MGKESEWSRKKIAEERRRREEVLRERLGYKVGDRFYLPHEHPSLRMPCRKGDRPNDLVVKSIFPHNDYIVATLDCMAGCGARIQLDENLATISSNIDLDTEHRAKELSFPDFYCEMKKP